MLKNIFIIIVCSIFFFCQSENKDNIDEKMSAEYKNKTTSLQKEINNTKHPLIPLFNKNTEYGTELLKWRDKNIEQPMSNLIWTDEKIWIPEKTQMIELEPFGDDNFLLSLGIGKILKKQEKKNLPLHISDSIYSHSVKKLFNLKLDDYDDFVLIAFSELYDISTLFDKNIDGTVFLALIKTKSYDFSEFTKFEEIESNNMYINIPLLSCYFVSFYRDKSGKYHVLKKALQIKYL